MVESLPVWIAAPAVAIGLGYALYRAYILPGYARDRAERNAR